MTPKALLTLITKLITLLERYLDHRKQKTAKQKAKAHQDKLDAIRRDPDRAWAERFGVRDGEGDSKRGDSNDHRTDGKPPSGSV